MISPGNILEVSTSLGKETSHTHVNRQEHPDSLPLGPRKYWEVSAHCDTLLLPQPRPEISFDNPAANYLYHRVAASGAPDPHMRKLNTQAHYRALAKLNLSQMQVRNFILPVQLMKLKNMDPFSRQRIVEELCKYFSFQQGLHNIVLEQAELKFEDLCRLLVAIAKSSKVKSLFLWHVLDNCDKPFEGPLQSTLPSISKTESIPDAGEKFHFTCATDEIEKYGSVLKTKNSRRTVQVFQGLHNIVLEQAELKFEDLCRLLVAIAKSSKVKSLFLWHVLDNCDKPFEGPLQSDTVLDDLPRIPYTYNPGGRKYLRDLGNASSPQGELSEGSKEILENGEILNMKPAVKSFVSHMDLSVETSQQISVENLVANEDSNYLLTQLGKLENMVIRCLAGSTSDNMTCKIIRKEFVHSVVPTNEEHVFSQADVGIQCTISQDFEEIKTFRDVPRVGHISTDDSRFSLADIQFHALKNTRLRFCEKYLKYYENTKVNLDVLRDIYTITLSTLTHLTQLAVNYCMVADGTGNALMSIGSIAKGKLKHLRLLCEPDDTPSPTHRLYGDNPLQAIPDLIWHSVQRNCPDLKVDIVCVSMSAYDVTKRFVTKSMPLSSFHMENGFCPNFRAPQLTIFCTLKCLWLDHAETLEELNLTLWHSTGRIDSSLEKLIEKTHLHSFAYHGPLQYKSSINKLCDAALNSPRMTNFKLMIQGDPCFPHIARELSSDLYNDYRQKFHDKTIHFALGTFNS